MQFFLIELGEITKLMYWDLLFGGFFVCLFVCLLLFLGGGVVWVFWGFFFPGLYLVDSFEC